MKRRVNWFTVASVTSLVAMIALGLFLLLTPAETSVNELAAIVVLGFAGLTSAVFAIHDTIITRQQSRDSENRS